MFKIRIATAVLAVGGILLAIASYALPVPGGALHAHGASLQTASAFQSTLSSMLLIVSYNLGAVVLFLLGLGGFTTAFRRTYYWITAGLGVQAVGSIAYIVVLYLGLLRTNAGIIITELPLAVGIVVIFYGLIAFARLLESFSWLTSIRTVCMVCVVLLGIVWFLPHKPDVGSSNELLFDIAHSLQFTEALFYGLCALLGIQILTVASPVYRRSMQWLVAAMLTALLAAGLLFSADYISYPAWLSLDVMAIPFLITNVFSMCAAYSFNKIHYIPVQRETHESALVDGILLLASLASKPSEISPIMDGLRFVTAAHHPGTPYTHTETAKLKVVYHRLQNYLVREERLRSFSRGQLNDLVRERFDISV